MNFKKSSPFKKCPRCNTKCLVNSKKCHYCELIFDRLNYTSNKTAKKNILKRRRNEVVMVTDWPLDAKKSTALLLCGFLGFSGAHNFYLGRFLKASFVLIGLILATVLVFLSESGLYGTTLYEVVHLIAIVPGSSVLILWFSDFIGIFLERYKIPVSIDENLYKLKDEVVAEQPSSKPKKSQLNKNKGKKN